MLINYINFLFFDKNSPKYIFTSNKYWSLKNCAPERCSLNHCSDKGSGCTMAWISGRSSTPLLLSYKSGWSYSWTTSSFGSFCCMSGMYLGWSSFLTAGIDLETIFTFSLVDAFCIFLRVFDYDWFQVHSAFWALFLVIPLPVDLAPASSELSWTGCSVLPVLFREAGAICCIPDIRDCDFFLTKALVEDEVLASVA